MAAIDDDKEKKLEQPAEASLPAKARESGIPDIANDPRYMEPFGSGDKEAMRSNTELAAILEHKAAKERGDTDEGFRLDERPGPRELLEGRDIAPFPYVDGEDRDMEIRVDRSSKGQTRDGDDFCILGLYHDDQRVGEMKMSMEYKAQGPGDNPQVSYGDARINYLEVSPAYRGAGNGERLVDKAVEVAQAYGAERVTGSPENDAARSFFEHLAPKGWEVREGGLGYNSIVRKIPRY
jgi:GNAT superfamily N-acetyltransferase